MKKAYDYARADRLVPLLRSVNGEIRDRKHAVRRLERQLAQLSSDEDEYFLVQAELANHRLEIRRAREELEQLGCVVDEANPLRVLIPGENGALEQGFAWEVGDAQVRALLSETMP